MGGGGNRLVHTVARVHEHPDFGLFGYDCIPSVLLCSIK